MRPIGTRDEVEHTTHLNKLRLACRTPRFSSWMDPAGARDQFAKWQAAQPLQDEEALPGVTVNRVGRISAFFGWLQSRVLRPIQPGGQVTDQGRR